MTKKECWYGIYPIKFIWNGPWNDPQLRYKKHLFNYWDIENFFFEIWKEETNTDEFFETWITKNGKRVKEHLDYLIEIGSAE